MGGHSWVLSQYNVQAAIHTPRHACMQPILHQPHNTREALVRTTGSVHSLMGSVSLMLLAEQPR